MPNNITTLISPRNKADLSKIVNKLCAISITPELLPTTGQNTFEDILSEQNILDVKVNVDFNTITPMPERLSVVAIAYNIYTYAIVCYLRNMSPIQYEEKLKPLYDISNDIFDNIKGKNYGSVVKLKLILARIDESEYENMRSKVRPYLSNGVTIEQFGERYYTNIIKYGHAHWYTWCVENWGTKWNAYNCFITEQYISFDTAWSTPEPIIVQLSKDLPEVEMFILYADEDIGFNYGAYIIKNGNKIESLPITNEQKFCRIVKHDQ